MVTHDEAVEMMLSLPEVTEGSSYSNRAWKVGKKFFAWDRPFSKADIKRFGAEPAPEGPILGVMVDDLAEKDAILSPGTPGIFTIPHFDGFAAVLVQLDAISTDDLREILVDGWLACAPAKLAEEFLRDHPIDE